MRLWELGRRRICDLKAACGLKSGYEILKAAYLRFPHRWPGGTHPK